MLSPPHQEGLEFHQHKPLSYQGSVELALFYHLASHP
jgi:hypothetical protein